MGNICLAKVLSMSKFFLQKKEIMVLIAVSLYCLQHRSSQCYPNWKTNIIGMWSTEWWWMWFVVGIPVAARRFYFHFQVHLRMFSSKNSLTVMITLWMDCTLLRQFTILGKHVMLTTYVMLARWVYLAVTDCLGILSSVTNNGMKMIKKLIFKYICQLSS